MSRTVGRSLLAPAGSIGHLRRLAEDGDWVIEGQVVARLVDLVDGPSPDIVTDIVAPEAGVIYYRHAESTILGGLLGGRNEVCNTLRAPIASYSKKWLNRFSNVDVANQLFCQGHQALAGWLISRDDNQQPGRHGPHVFRDVDNNVWFRQKHEGYRGLVHVGIVCGFVVLEISDVLGTSSLIRANVSIQWDRRDANSNESLSGTHQFWLDFASHRSSAVPPADATPIDTAPAIMPATDHAEYAKRANMFATPTRVLDFAALSPLLCHLSDEDREALRRMEVAWSAIIPPTTIDGRLLLLRHDLAIARIEAYRSEPDTYEQRAHAIAQGKDPDGNLARMNRTEAAARAYWKAHWEKEHGRPQSDFQGLLVIPWSENFHEARAGQGTFYAFFGRPLGSFRSDAELMTIDDIDAAVSVVTRSRAVLFERDGVRTESVLDRELPTLAVACPMCGGWHVDRVCVVCGEQLRQAQFAERVDKAHWHLPLTPRIRDAIESATGRRFSVPWAKVREAYIRHTTSRMALKAVDHLEKAKDKILGVIKDDAIRGALAERIAIILQAPDPAPEVDDLGPPIEY